MSVFRPKMYQKDIFKIDYQKLKKSGYKILILDLDNTLGSVKDEVCQEEVATFLKKLKKDFIIYVASNNHKNRVKKFCDPINCKYISSSLKPTRFGILKIKKQEKFDYQEMVIIGDQILTDILLGNRLGMLTILVDPVLDFDLKVTRLNRKIETILKKKYKIKRGSYYD